MRVRLLLLLMVLPAGGIDCQVPAFLDPDTTTPANTVYKTFRSATIKGDVSYLLYLPPGYSMSAEKRYPVVYWLHGLGGDQRGGAAFVKQLQAAIHAGQAPPLIAVLVNGLRDSRYYNSFDGKRPVESVILQDLIPHIDQTYRTIARREYRAIEGFSMGGFGAAHLGFGHPELFGAVSIMAGALLDDDSVSIRHPDLFEKNFGSNKAYFHKGSPWVLVRENAARIRGKVRVRMGVGDQDELLQLDLKYSALLKELKIAHEFFTVPGVGHQPTKFYEKLGAEAFAFYHAAFP